jgi:hypothetical protein
MATSPRRNIAAASLENTPMAAVVLPESSDPEIAEKVRHIVAEALALDPATVKNESLLMTDLGAE